MPSTQLSEGPAPRLTPTCHSHFHLQTGDLQTIPSHCLKTSVWLASRRLLFPAAKAEVLPAASAPGALAHSPPSMLLLLHACGSHTGPRVLHPNPEPDPALGQPSRHLLHVAGQLPQSHWPSILPRHSPQQQGHSFQRTVPHAGRRLPSFLCRDTVAPAPAVLRGRPCVHLGHSNSQAGL